MANICLIRNTRRLDSIQVQTLLLRELEQRWQLPVVVEDAPEVGGVILNIRGLQFPFWVTPEAIEFFDTADCAFTKYHQQHPYLKVMGQLVALEVPCAYKYLHEYLKNFLAHYLGVDLDSDGAGPYAPFSPTPSKYESLKKYQQYFIDRRLAKRNRPRANLMEIWSLHCLRQGDHYWFPELMK